MGNVTWKLLFEKCKMCPIRLDLVKCMGHVQNIYRKCIEHVQTMYGTCMENVWNMDETCMQNICQIFGDFRILEDFYIICRILADFDKFL